MIRVQGVGFQMEHFGLPLKGKVDALHHRIKLGQIDVLGVIVWT